MSAIHYPILLWRDPSGTTTAALLGDFDTVAASGATENEARSQLKELLEWRFEHDPAGTRVEFSIDFEFKSRLLDAFLAANMERAVDKLIGCFEGRARALYGAMQA